MKKRWRKLTIFNLIAFYFNIDNFRRVLLLFFVVLTQGFCLLLMDSEYNYAAKKDDKPAFRSSKWVLKCPTWSLKEHLKM